MGSRRLAPWRKSDRAAGRVWRVTLAAPLLAPRCKANGWSPSQLVADAAAHPAERNPALHPDLPGPSLTLTLEPRSTLALLSGYDAVSRPRPASPDRA